MNDRKMTVNWKVSAKIKTKWPVRVAEDVMEKMKDERDKILVFVKLVTRKNIYKTILTEVVGSEATQASR